MTADLTSKQAGALAELAAAPDGLRYCATPRDRAVAGSIYWSDGDRLAELGYAEIVFGFERTFVRVTDAGRAALDALGDSR